MTITQQKNTAHIASNSGLQELSAFLKQESTERRSIPPLEKWHPENCGDMNMVIKANGEWWHEGSRIVRQSLVNLFATVLWKEGDDTAPEYYLKTPVEKIRIIVEDSPFLITEVNVVTQEGNHKNSGSTGADVGVIEFITSTGDVVVLDEEHPLMMKSYQGEERPYIMVRFGMMGLISRNVFMHLITLGTLTEREGKTTLTLQSGTTSYQVSVSN